MTTEYRVVWKRKSFIIKPNNSWEEPFLYNPKPKSRTYKRLNNAKKFALFLGPEPWTSLNLNPDKEYCCNGNYCGCGGMTNKEYFLFQREGMPEIEYIRIESRDVEEWKELGK